NANDTFIVATPEQVDSLVQSDVGNLQGLTDTSALHQLDVEYTRSFRRFDQLNSISRSDQRFIRSDNFTHFRRKRFHSGNVLCGQWLFNQFNVEVVSPAVELNSLVYRVALIGIDANDNLVAEFFTKLHDAFHVLFEVLAKLNLDYPESA